MGAELSILNDIEGSCVVEVWTIGQGIIQSAGSVSPGHTHLVYHAATWYDVVFKVWRLGIQDVRTQRVLLGNRTTYLELSSIFDPEVMRRIKDMRQQKAASDSDGDWKLEVFDDD